MSTKQAEPIQPSNPAAANQGVASVKCVTRTAGLCPKPAIISSQAFSTLLGDGQEIQHAQQYPRFRVLIVDDDPSIRHTYATVVEHLGYLVEIAHSAASARVILSEGPVDIILLNLRMPGKGGLELLEEIRKHYPRSVAIIVTGLATIASAVESMRLGAADYLEKPFTIERLSRTLKRASVVHTKDMEARLIRDQVMSELRMRNIITCSPAMEKMGRMLSRVCLTTRPVLINGETGTGKEHMARIIHQHGPNRDEPFISVDCASLMSDRLTDKLFGHVQGAFPGAHTVTVGSLVTAGKGTVVLRDVHALSINVQSRLARALQDHEVRPIGSIHAQPFSARIIATSNRDLDELAASGHFRKDLHSHLSTLALCVPPLRERKCDIPALAQQALERLDTELRGTHSFVDDALQLLVQYDWPGNQIELDEAVEQACVHADGAVLHTNDFPVQMQAVARKSTNQATIKSSKDAVKTSAKEDIHSLAELEKEAILDALEKLHHNKLLVAHQLGIGKTTLYRKLKEYGLS